jgi:fumarate reductase subunit D
VADCCTPAAAAAALLPVPSTHLLAYVHIHWQLALRLKAQLRLTRLPLLLVLRNLPLHVTQHRLQHGGREGRWDVRVVQLGQE